MCILKLKIKGFSENIDESLYSKNEGIDLEAVTDDTNPTG